MWASTIPVSAAGAMSSGAGLHREPAASVDVELARPEERDRVDPAHDAWDPEVGEAGGREPVLYLRHREIKRRDDHELLALGLVGDTHDDERLGVTRVYAEDLGDLLLDRPVGDHLPTHL